MNASEKAPTALREEGGLCAPNHASKKGETVLYRHKSWNIATRTPLTRQRVQLLLKRVNDRERIEEITLIIWKNGFQTERLMPH